MNKDYVKNIICQAINHIPKYAEISDCYVEHSYGSSEAYIKIRIETKNKDNKTICKFHDLAHNSFDTEMDLIS
jgi:hypothetical protein